MKRLPGSVQFFIIAFSLSKFLWYFNFFWLIQNIYFLEKGISYTQLSILLGIWSLGILILEIPSGAFADKFGRKLTIIISRVAFLVGLIIFVYYPTFLGIAIGMVFWAVNESFMSGAEEALLYDYLKENGKESIFNKVLSLSSVAREFGLGLGVLIAGFVTQYSIQYNLYGSLVIATLAIIPTLFLVEPKKIMHESPETHYLSFFKSAYAKIKKDSYLKDILFFSVTVMLSYQVITQYFTVALYKLDINFVSIGIFALAETLFFTLGSFLVNKLDKLHAKTVYLWVAITMTIFTALIGLGTVFAVIASYMLLRTVKAIGEIYSLNDWQKRVDSHDRATSTSFISFLTNSAYLPAAFIFGKLADSKGLFPSYYYVAFLPIVYVALHGVTKKKSRTLS